MRSKNSGASHLGEFTDATLAAQPLTERAEILLGLKPWPKERKQASA